MSLDLTRRRSSCSVLDTMIYWAACASRPWYSSDKGMRIRGVAKSGVRSRPRGHTGPRELAELSMSVNARADHPPRGISFVLSSVVFHVIPTALEITMVCGILVSLRTSTLTWASITERGQLGEARSCKLISISLGSLAGTLQLSRRSRWACTLGSPLPLQHGGKSRLVTAQLPLPTV